MSERRTDLQRCNDSVFGTKLRLVRNSCDVLRQEQQSRRRKSLTSGGVNAPARFKMHGWSADAQHKIETAHRSR
jgi:hypothetical protein